MSSQHALPQTVVPDGTAAPLTHLTSQRAMSSDEDVGYAPVPPREVFTVSVELRVAGRGKPLPYPDEGDRGA
jgi:hypothetical protein